VGIQRYQHYVAGRDLPSASGRTFDAVDPARGAAAFSFAEGEAADVERAVAAAYEAWESGPWSRLAASRRGRLLMRLGDKIGENAERIAEIETRQNGKLYKEMVAQLRTVPDWLYYYGGLADKVEGRVIPLDRQSVLNYTLRESLGVVGVITPWNSPVFLTMMAVAPALAAGNTVVVKPSEVTSASIIEVMKLAAEVGFPAGVLNTVTGLRAAGEALVDHPKVAKIAFTGGVEAGRRIAERCGARLAHCTLELGGKSANIVFADANLEAAEAGVLAGIFAAAGQTCVAGSRTFIERPVFDRFVARLAERAAAIVIGDPMRPETQMGPVATKAQLEKNLRMVARAVEQGGRLVHGGGRPQVAGLPDGFFFQPTILTGVRANSELACNEVFGPVLSVTPFADEAEAVALANDSAFGLAAGVWSLDARRIHKMARALKAGTVWLNMYRAMAPQSPFGGYKQSGIGRQCGAETIDQYLQTKSVWSETSDEVQDPFVLRT
jgi:aldehyde dehydrogenase (NAD+)